MIYNIKCSEMPNIDAVYSVIRKTVWEIADPNYIIIFIKDGQCSIELDGKSYTLLKGDLFFIPANARYIRKPLNDEFCEIYYIHFQINGTISEYENHDILAKELRQKSKDCIFPQKGFGFLVPNKISFKSKFDMIFTKIDEIKNSYNGSNTFDRQISAFALCELLSIISNTYIQALYTKTDMPEHPAYPEPLKKAVTYIKNHLTEKITLEDLCEVSFVSKQMLIRHFNKAFNKSPIEYITEYKINNIRSILTRYPDMSIKEICEEFGFEDQCYFSRIFKKHTGESPTEYRKRIGSFDQRKHLMQD